MELYFGRFQELENDTPRGSEPRTVFGLEARLTLTPEEMVAYKQAGIHARGAVNYKPVGGDTHAYFVMEFVEEPKLDFLVRTPDRIRQIEHDLLDTTRAIAQHIQYISGTTPDIELVTEDWD